MKARRIGTTLALCLIGAALCLAADGFLGTWKLNEAKSKLAPGTAKNSTVVYSAMGDQMMVTIDGTDGAGKPMHNEWMGKFDARTTRSPAIPLPTRAPSRKSMITR
jgi:hypothetical protein